MKLSIKGLTGAAAMLAAALGLNLLGPHRAYSAPAPLALPGESDLGVTILSPDPHLLLTGLKPVEISAFYQGTPGNQIVSVDLILDGAKVASKTLDVPETRGVVSFLVDSAQLTAGTHRVVIRATAADQEVKSAKSEFTFGAAASPLSSGPLSPPTNPNVESGAAPTLHLINPSEDGKVRGVVTLRVEASDPSGKAPYVSLFIDKTFKTLRNFSPYEFQWDTTDLPNGYHTVEVFGYNDSPNVGHSQTLRLYVNNPGGETNIRHDLLDTPPPTLAIAPHSRLKPSLKPSAKIISRRVATSSGKRLGRPLPLRRPELRLPQMASVVTTHGASNQEVVSRIARGASAIHLHAPNFAADLSLPFLPETPAPQGQTPVRGYKPLPMVDPSTAKLANTPTARRAIRQMARLQGMAGLRLPGSELAMPFLADPQAAPLAHALKFQSSSYQAEMRFARHVLQPAMTMHSLRVHFPSSLGSLLRSVGQTSVLFNHTTVKLDRPISAQGSVVFGPLRQIFEQGGGSLTWQARSGTVHAKNATRDIVLTIGQRQALINAKTVVLEGKPYLLTGRTMVPLSFVSAALDADVQYDAATGHLLITSRQ